MGRKPDIDGILYSRQLLGKTRRLLVEARHQELLPYHVSPVQVGFLNAVYELGEKATLAELAKYFDRAINTVSLQMTGLEKLGLINKTPANPRSRLLRFELTEKGIELYLYAKANISVKAIMGVLTEKERLQLDSLLGKMLSAAENLKQAHNQL